MSEEVEFIGTDSKAENLNIKGHNMAAVKLRELNKDGVLDTTATGDHKIRQNKITYKMIIKQKRVKGEYIQNTPGKYICVQDIYRLRHIYRKR